LIANAVDVNTATSAINVYVRPKIGGEVRVTLTGTTDAYAPIRADSLIANAIDINTLITGATHIYVRPKSGGEVRFTTTGSTTSYTNVRGSLAYFDGIANNTGTNLYLGTTTEVYVTSVGMGANTPIVFQPIRADGFKGDYLDSNPSNASSTNVYIRPKVGGEVRATETGGTTTYVPVRASSFPLVRWQSINKI
jgi:hypothetical protein